MVDFEQLNEEFKAVFQVDWNMILPSWYMNNKNPTYLLKIAKILRVKTENSKDCRYRIEFAVFNDSDVDGVVKFRTSTYLPGGWPEMQRAQKEKRREENCARRKRKRQRKKLRKRI